MILTPAAARQRFMRLQTTPPLFMRMICAPVDLIRLVIAGLRATDIAFAAARRNRARRLSPRLAMGAIL